ncbi:unnamed protein product [Microthlaspi erraticum]|uniref:DUF1640 domain-containing protein n=1 Tax=Microthlaspi erraticum TaxID=1685480 RepID=A0A6D2IYC6_9BRAS|nr:unnamed protein product [Microthlaspi erraticum]
MSTIVKHLSRRRFCTKTIPIVDTLVMVRALEEKKFPSEQAEALTETLSCGLKTGMERIKEELVKSQESLVAKGLAKFRDEIQKMQTEIGAMQVETRRKHNEGIHKLEQMVIEIPSDAMKEFQQLKADFEATKYIGVNYAIITLAVTAATGLGLFCLMW